MFFAHKLFFMKISNGYTSRTITISDSKSGEMKQYHFTSMDFN